MEEKIFFEERQYLGYNRYSLIRFMVLALFCFVAYWWSEHNGQKGDLFFWAGTGILFLLLTALFVLHLKTQVFENHIILDGLWTTRRVKIDLGNIVKVERKKYSHYRFNNPVYNLHLKGTIRFYTGGTEAVEITDREGLPYRIGTQRPLELEKVLKELTVNNKI